MGHLYVSGWKNMYQLIQCDKWVRKRSCEFLIYLKFLVHLCLRKGEYSSFEEYNVVAASFLFYTISTSPEAVLLKKKKKEKENLAALMYSSFQLKMFNFLKWNLIYCKKKFKLAKIYVYKISTLIRLKSEFLNLPVETY